MSQRVAWTGRDGAIVVPLGDERSVIEASSYGHHPRRCEEVIEPGMGKVAALNRTD
ncbi:MAG: hypothetical protein P8M78_06380 [Myxococcota bacterium]|nr:hypothetical protein [Myxococcota bacterium]